MTPSTTIRANVDPKFYSRFKLIAVAALGFALWSLYDGFVTYPNQRERALKYYEFEKEGRISEWREYALERGWPTVTPGEPKTDGNIIMQYFMATVAGTVSLVLLVVVLRSRGRWIEASETGLTSSWGQSFEFDQVLSLNKKQWPDKGIARIKYEQGKRRKQFVLDNYKFLRQATGDILRQLESKIETDKIVGGQPEPPLEESPS